MFEMIERYVFFPIVRTTAIVIASVVLLAIIGGLIFILTFNGIKKENVISFLEVRSTIYHEETGGKDGKQLKIPQNVKKYIEDNYMRYLDTYLVNMETEQQKTDFLKSIDKDRELADYSLLMLDELFSDVGIRTVNEKNDFLKNLSKIIAEAKIKDPENIEKYIKVFIPLYGKNAKNGDDPLGLGKLIGSDAVSKIVQGINSAITSLIKGVIGFTLLILFLLLTITIVLLSLLSIERNTRKETVGK
jgi:hypothetical protein